MKVKKNSRRLKGSSAIFAFILGIVISFALFAYFRNEIFPALSSFPQSQAQVHQVQVPTASISTTTTTVTRPGNNIPVLSGKEITMILPAVDDEGNGVATRLYVEAIYGKGRVLADVNNIFFFFDTQNSIRVAQRVAQNVTGLNLSGIDLIYRIDAGNVTALEGPSAGAALTVATIAALEGRDVNQSVILTGTIEADGSIGPVGAIEEKAKAAKDVGASLFLVPSGQGTTATYKSVRKCEIIGPFQYCTTEYVGTRKDISSSAGITVKEVSNIKDALSYLLV